MCCIGYVLWFSKFVDILFNVVHISQYCLLMVCAHNINDAYFRVMQLNQEIEKVKETQTAGYSRGGQTEQNIQLNLGALAALDAADLSSGGKCLYDIM